ncbi:hypothetical protein DP107_11800, partial [Haloglomus irregulare]
MYLVTIVGLAMLATGSGFVGVAAGAAGNTAPDCSTVSYSGSGTSSDPYEVGNVDQLQCIENQGLGDHYELTGDIDASRTDQWNDDGSGAKGFDPIGDSGTPFTGTFDGNGHTISGPTIDRGSTNYVGLFGLTEGSTVEKVGLVDVSVTGNDNTGGLVGQSDKNAVVRESFVSGTVSGNKKVGGLVGRNSYTSSSAATVEDSYSLADVTGENDVGGVVGFEVVRPDIPKTVKRTYATGDIEATSGPFVGGIAGANEGDVRDSYWDKGTTNQDRAIGARLGGASNLNGYGSTGDTSPAPEMQGSTATSKMGALDFASTWGTVENSEGDTTGDGYPILQSVDRQAQLEAQNVNAYAGGDGTAGTPYEIANWHHLDNVRQNLDKEFVLTTGLNSGTAGYGSVADSSANSNNGFDPIGDSGAPFTGTFDGDNDTISDLSIDRGSTDYVGLFGDVGSAGRVERVGVESAGITGDYFVGGIAGNSSGTITASNTSGQVSGTGAVGGLVGQNRGTISGSFATGDISGQYDVGGLVGKNKASITTSYVTGSATGDYDIGGLVGLQNGGTVTGSYATADVTGNNDGAGGLVGQNRDDSSVSRSYASGTVDGSENVGGLVGNNGGTVSNSYWDIQQTGQETSDGDAVGIFTRDMVGANALDSANMSALTTPTWETVTASTPGADDDGYPILQGLDAGPQIRTPDPSVSKALFVNILNGGTIVLGFEASDTVLSVKEQLEARTGLVADRQDLIFAGKALDDDRTLSDYNVQKGSTLTLVQAALYGGGDGSESTPYEIANWHHLDNVSQNTGAEFKLTADLDSGTAGYDEVASDTANSNKGFDPIGDPGNQFTGTFDGDDHTISGLNIDRKNTQNVGLFGIVSGGTVENVGVENVEINGSEYVGGLAGRNNAAVTKSYATGDVNGTKFVGGLIGENLEDVSESYATGNVNATRNVGGLVGENEGNVTESYATGDVKGDEDYGGGLAGLNYGNVTKSYATGDVDGDMVGGLVGFNNGGSDSNGYVANAYATGDVSGTQDAGGLVGLNPGGTVEDAYWDVNTTGQSSSAGSPDANGLTTVEMQRFAPQVTMDGFSFESPETWLVTGGYPALAWESVTELTVDSVEATSPTVAEDESGTITVTAKESGSDAGEGVTIEVVDDDGLDGFATSDTKVTDTNGEVTFTFDEPNHGSYTPEFAWGDDTSVSATPTVTVQDAPEVTSIERASPTSQNTNADSVDFDVTFSTEVDGIDTSDFTLHTTNTASGSIQSVGSGTASNTVTVTVGLITGDGDLRLDVSDDDSIEDTTNNVALGGEGTGGSADGSFTSGETYAIDNTPPSLSNFVLENDNSPGSSVGDGDTIRVAVFVSETANNVANVEADLSAFGAPSDVTLDDNNVDGNYDTTVTVDKATANEDGSYSVTIATSDDIGNQNTGSTSSLELNTNEAPTLDTNAGVTVDEGSTANQITNAELAASDPEQSAGSITYDVTTAPSDGTLFVDGGSGGTDDGTRDGESAIGTGTFTQADIDAGNLLYSHDGSEASTDTFDFDLKDGKGGTTAGNTFSIALDGVNDPPTLSLSTSDPTFTEDGSSVGVFSSANVGVVEGSQQVNSLELTVSNVADGSAEQLIVDGSSVALTDTKTVITANNALSASVSVSGSTATVTIDGSVSESTADTIINNLAYEHTGDDPSTAGDRTVTLTKLVDDGGTSNGGVDTTTFSKSGSVSITSVNDAPLQPSDSDGANNEVPEGASKGDSVGVTASSTDVDDDDRSLTYTLTDDASGRFQIDSPTGEVTVADASKLDHESSTSHTITVEGSDGSLSSPTKDFTITITDSDETPSFTNSGPASVAESDTDGTNVHDVNANVGGSADQSVSYQFTGGNSDSAYAIDSNGQITVNDASKIDYEQSTSRTLTVEASEGGQSATQDVTINVDDADESPTFSTGTSDTIAEDAANDDPVHDADANVGGSSDGGVSYAITSGNSAGAFSIDSSTGQIDVADHSQFDHEGTSSFSLTVEASEGGQSNTQIVSISVTDVDETPSFTNSGPASVAESDTGGTNVHDVNANVGGSTDEGVSYQFTSGNGDSAYAIDSNGQVTVNDASKIDYEQSTSRT